MNCDSFAPTVVRHLLKSRLSALCARHLSFRSISGMADAVPTTEEAGSMEYLDDATRHLTAFNSILADSSGSGPAALQIRRRGVGPREEASAKVCWQFPDSSGARTPGNRDTAAHIRARPHTPRSRLGYRYGTYTIAGRSTLGRSTIGRNGPALVPPLGAIPVAISMAESWV